MSIFENIEISLEKLRIEVGGIISKDRPNYPEPLRTFEERRIDWEDNEICKAIIIQPTFELKEVNSKLWNFYLVAWSWTEKRRVSYRKEIILKADFEVIETNIQKLLSEGKETLLNIKLEDLK